MRHECLLIAVVDDDRVYLDLICEFLVEEGYEVICCSTAQEARRLIGEGKPDLVLLDLWLEHSESGWTILELLRRDRATKDMPILVCSADSLFLQTHADRLREYNCEVLEKPFDLDVLLTKISVLLAVPEFLELEV